MFSLAGMRIRVFVVVAVVRYEVKYRVVSQRSPRDGEHDDEYVCFYSMNEEECCRSNLYRCKLHLVGVSVQDMADPEKKVICCFFPTVCSQNITLP